MYMSPEPVVLPSVALGLLITFRTNTANLRYNEARCLWGEIVNTSRDITRLALQWVPQSRDDTFGKAQAAKARGTEPVWVTGRRGVSAATSGGLLANRLRRHEQPSVGTAIALDHIA